MLTIQVRRGDSRPPLVTSWNGPLYRGGGVYLHGWNTYSQQGLADPPIDDLMEHADSKYALAIFAAKRARQINSYFTQLNEGLLQNVGPLVEYQNQEKPLSIAFREINSGLLEETLGEDDLSEGN